MLKLLSLVVVLVSLASIANGQEATTSRLLDPKMLIDGPLQSLAAPLLYRTKGDQYWSNQPLIPKSVVCGHLEMKGENSYRGHLPEASKYSCKQTIIGMDFANRSLLVLIDLVKEWQPKPEAEKTVYPIGRYLARIKTEATIFMAGLSTARLTGDKKLDSLLMVIQRLSELNRRVGQERYLDGTLTVHRLGPMKWDPEGKGLIFSGEDDHLTDRRLLINAATPITYTIVSNGNDVKTYPKPTEIFKALSETLKILKSGYESLKMNSDEVNQSKFHELVSTSAPTIAAELGEALRLMQTTQYHPMELGFAVTQIGDLIGAIDAILQGGTGTEPGLIEIIREKEME